MSAQMAFEKDWEISATAEMVATFLARKEQAGESAIVANLAKALVHKIQAGSSHLTPGEVEEIAGNPEDLEDYTCVGSAETMRPIVLTPSGRLYLRRYYEYEQTVFNALQDRLGPNKHSSGVDASRFFQDTFVKPGHIDPKQALAVGAAIQNRLLLLTGGPGTGKTRTIVILLASLLHQLPSLKIATAAPTGKAAFRMRESMLNAIKLLGLPEDVKSSLENLQDSSTIHRLLGSKRDSVDFHNNAKNPLQHDVVVVDEASMVDLPLMAKLCDALKPGSRLILVGDADQLAPVQGGPVYNSLVRNFLPNVFPKKEIEQVSNYSGEAQEAGQDDCLAGSLVSLSQSHRMASDSAKVLGSFCDAIKEGDSAQAIQILTSDETDATQYIPTIQDPQVDQLVAQQYEELAQSVKPDAAIEAFGRFRILCALNNGIFGVEAFNQRAAQALAYKNPRFNPIVITINDYANGLFNGDDGLVSRDRAYFQAVQDLREVSPSRLPAHLPAYATTIHRSQGSEYDHVLIVLPPPSSRILTRQLLYVAASRAKKGLVIVGEKESLENAIGKSSEPLSGLPAMLKGNVRRLGALEKKC